MRFNSDNAREMQRRSASAKSENALRRQVEEAAKHKRLASWFAAQGDNELERIEFYLRYMARLVGRAEEEKRFDQAAQIMVDMIAFERFRSGLLRRPWLADSASHVEGSSDNADDRTAAIVTRFAKAS